MTTPHLIETEESVYTQTAICVTVDHYEPITQSCCGLPSLILTIDGPIWTIKRTFLQEEILPQQ